MFENLQDLKKRAHQELLIHANPVAKLRRVPKEKLRRIMEEEINFLTNRMHERIKTKLLSVCIFLFRKKLTPLLKKPIGSFRL